LGWRYGYRLGEFSPVVGTLSRRSLSAGANRNIETYY
jgi:hypothetical protein